MSGALLLVLGKLGLGIYLTEAPENDVDIPAMQYLWDKTADYGYNKGCLIVVTLEGLTIRAKNKVHDSLIVPEGCSIRMIYSPLGWSHRYDIALCAVSNFMFRRMQLLRRCDGTC